MKTRESHTFLSVRFIFPHLNCRFMPKAHLIVNLLLKTSFLLSSSSFCVLKINFFCAIPCKLKKNNLYLRLGKNNLNVHAYEDNVDFTNFSPLDIRNATAGTIMDNAYTYDAVSNVLSVKNGAPLPQSGKAGGQMSHSYTYDPLYRLASATGTYAGANSKTASYTLAMGYDNMHRITSKKQHLTQSNVQFNGTLNAGYDLTYTYGSAEGKKFQLDNVRDINYRTEETPTDSTNINNGHKYIYDANGNLVYINTSRVKRDGKEDEKASEQKYRWDEENRLLAADENGFVSNYWYDADGERTVKTSGENEAIYVNSEFSGGNTSTARFSLYVSPYLVAGQGGKYTKHIYIGSQRIVSKLGDLASYGADPRRIPYAGNEADGLSINYKDKYNLQLQSIKDNYKTFDLPYSGKDNDDYVNGQGFCCNDGTLEAAQARAMARTRTTNGNFHDKDNYEKMQFYYHPDHLGSSSYITNLDGEVSQHIEYVPFGEVFIEERNNTWNTPYLFNAKEFDEETGMYYYGARYYEPRLSLWMSCDPIGERAYDKSIYNYCSNNPVIRIDPDGKADYYSNSNAKYLGSDNDPKTQGVLRLISNEDYVAFTGANANYTKLAQNSTEIKINNDKIQSDAQKIRDLSKEHRLENQMYIYIDRQTGEISSVIGQEGTNNRTEIVTYPAPSQGLNFIFSPETPRTKILIGQMHGHPDIEIPNHTTLSDMSELDRNTAMELQIPIYGIDAMSGSGKQGASANINRVDPDGTRHLKIGNTMGIKNKNKDPIDIGRQSLEIWGRSKSVNQ